MKLTTLFIKNKTSVYLNFLLILALLESVYFMKIKNFTTVYPPSFRKQDFKNYNTEYSVVERNVQFNISQSSECNVLINDTILIKRESDFNYIEHWILNNNEEMIVPISVSSDDVNVKLFLFNNKMNLFTVFIDFGNKEIKKFFLNFQYQSLNLISSNFNAPDSDSDNFFINNNNSNQNEDYIDFSKINYNSMLFKFHNKNNVIDSSEILKIEINFDLGKEFKNFDITSHNFKFNKQNYTSITGNETKEIVKYTTTKNLEPQNILILEIEFPLYFENCKYNAVSIIKILIGSIVITFIIFLLYIVFNSVIFNELL
jgi:hypothetical protein